MKQFVKNNLDLLTHSLILIFIVYLCSGIGLYSDDWAMLSQLKGQSAKEVFLPDMSKIHVLVLAMPSYYIDVLQYYFLDTKLFFYDFLKIFFIFISYFVVYIFFKQYFEKWQAICISLFFILFFTHDSINYWQITLPTLVVPALAMYAHHLINNNKSIKGFLTSFIGSFMGFSSPPYFLGLSIVFLLKKEYNKFFIFIVPQFIYIIYYFIIVYIFHFTQGRINANLSIESLLKQFLLQLCTAIDTFFGPSMLLKMIYSLSSLSFSSVLIALFAIFMFYRFISLTNKSSHVQSMNVYILCGIVAVVFFSFAMFAVTGFYPQITFNLGNRVTIYGSLLLSFLIVTFLMRTRLFATIVFAIFIFTTLGISDHWKSWNKTQQSVIHNISVNPELAALDANTTLFVSGSQYSKYGPLSHIEFFSESFVVSSVFKHALGDKYTYKTSTLNHRFVYENGQLMDKKYGDKLQISDTVLVYDSEKNRLFRLKADELNAYISSLPPDNRHWLQLLDKDNPLLKFAVYLMPRLQYAL